MKPKQKTNIILVENSIYGNATADLFRQFFPKVSILFSGGTLDEISVFMQKLRPEKEEKYIIVTAGTVDGGINLSGSGYQATVEWMNNLDPSTNFKNITVIANPSFEERSKDSYPLFRGLHEICDSHDIRLFTSAKENGPKTIIKAMRQALRTDSLVEGDFKARRK